MRGEEAGLRALHLIKTGVGAIWALRQIEVLIDLGIDVHIALGERGPMAGRYRSVGATVHHTPVDFAEVVRSGVGAYRSAAQKLRYLVSNIEPDIIHSHFVGTTLFARLALGRADAVPRVFQVPGPLHLEKLLPRIIDIQSASGSDHFVATCELSRTIYLRNGVAPERVHLSYYGTDVEAFTPITPDPLKRDEIGVPRDAAVVGMVAYMYPPKKWIGQRTGLKGHEDLIEAIGLLHDRGKNVFGVFVGGAWGQANDYEAHLRRIGQARLGRRAVFLGTRKDVRALYRSFDVVAHPSHSENLGGAAESLLLSVPTIATRVGGIPDIVKHQRTGLLVPPHCPQALAEAIEETLAEPIRARSMATEGSKLVREMLNVRKTGREISEIYQKVLDLHSRSEAML